MRPSGSSPIRVHTQPGRGATLTQSLGGADIRQTQGGESPGSSLECCFQCWVSWGPWGAQGSPGMELQVWAESGGPMLVSGGPQEAELTRNSFALCGRHGGPSSPGTAEQRALGRPGCGQHGAEARFWAPGSPAPTQGWLPAAPAPARVGSCRCRSGSPGRRRPHSGGHGQVLPEGQGAALVLGCLISACPGTSPTGLQTRLGTEPLQGRGTSTPHPPGQPRAPAPGCKLAHVLQLTRKPALV